MNDDAASPENDAGPSVPSGAVSRELPIINKRGLHARASAKFVQMVERFNAEVWVTRGSETVGGTSIMGLMMLSAGPGTSIVVSAIGPEAQAAIDAITGLAPASSTKKAREAAAVGVLDYQRALPRPALAGVIPGWSQRVGALRRPMTGSGPDLRCAIAHRESRDSGFALRDAPE